jgi:hypothetical protein
MKQEKMNGTFNGYGRNKTSVANLSHKSQSEENISKTYQYIEENNF